MAPLATPPGRYDAPRSRPSRLVLTGATVLLGVLGLVAAYLLFNRASGGGAQGTVLTYRVVSDSAVDIRFEVHRPSGRTAVCALRARDADGAPVGSADVEIPATGGRVVRVEHRLGTRSRASTGEVDGCAVRSSRP